MLHPERSVRPRVGQQYRSSSYRDSEQQYVDYQITCPEVHAHALVDLNPVWDEIIYTPVHSLKESLLLEVMDYQNLTKDRSLGTVELKVSELAQEIVKGVGDPRFSFDSTGKMEKSEPIRLDRGNQYKGQLHYVAEFLPAFALQDLKFETSSNDLSSTVEGEDSEDADEDSSLSKEQVLTTTTEPIGVPKDSSKNQPANTREGSPSSQTDGRDGVKEKNEGIRMSKDELLTHRRWWLHPESLFITFDHRVRDYHLSRQVWRAFQEESLGGSPR